MFLVLFAVVLLETTASAGRFSDTTSHLRTATRALRFVKFGTKSQIAAAKKSLQAAVAAAKAARKAKNAANRALVRGKTIEKRLYKQAAHKNAKPAKKRAARAAAAAIPGLKAALHRAEKADARAQAAVIEAREYWRKLNTKRNNAVINVAGYKRPSICYCAREAAGEGSCYQFTNGRYCESRACESKHVCTSKKVSGGAVCFLRRITSQVVPTGRGRCRRKPADSYMYVPYWTQ